MFADRLVDKKVARAVLIKSLIRLRINSYPNLGYRRAIGDVDPPALVRAVHYAKAEIQCRVFEQLCESRYLVLLGFLSCHFGVRIPSRSINIGITSKAFYGSFEFISVAYFAVDRSFLYLFSITTAELDTRKTRRSVRSPGN